MRRWLIWCLLCLPACKKLPDWFDMKIKAPAEDPLRDEQGRTLVEYGIADGEPLLGYFQPNSKNNPEQIAVLALHNSTGLTSDFAKMLEGFVGKDRPFLAINLLQSKTWAQNADIPSLTEQMSKKTPTKIYANIEQGFHFLQEKSNAKKIIIVGWGLGGTWATRTVYYYPDWYRVLINFYGNTDYFLQTMQKWTTPSYAIVAEKDPHANIDSVASMSRQLELAPAEIKVIIAANAHSGFMEPYLRDVFDEQKFRAISAAAWDFIMSKI